MFDDKINLTKGSQLMSICDKDIECKVIAKECQSKVEMSSYSRYALYTRKMLGLGIIFS